ncbi:MAG: glycosyltransferase [Bacteroidetes bacterium]|nr:glycosyltransferase [Bacteroidota bacterium]
MRFLFLIQGEGRGHLTQALSFANLLKKEGHELVGVVVGKSPRRQVPDFFLQKIGVAVMPVESPNFETDGQEKKILLRKTIRKSLAKLPTYWTSLQKIHALVQDTQPEVVVNFYEPLAGLYHLFFATKIAFWAIGHQYLEKHPEFTFAPNRGLEKFLFRVHTRITAWGASERLALSFLPKENRNGVQVVPPLLRQEVQELTVSQGDFFLTYMVNPGYAEEVLTFARNNPNVNIKAFWDKKGAAENEYPLPNLSFHQVNDQKFLEAMAACKGLLCTAGFESVCEAMYLGKPVVMVPIAGQFEQACNALDGEQSGAGKKADFFDFDLLTSLHLPEASHTKNYQEWSESWPESFRKLVEKLEPEPKKVSAEFVYVSS